MNVFAGLMQAEQTAPRTQAARSVLNEAKAKASKIADIAQQTGRGAHDAADKILSMRRTKGAHAALFAGLVIGALCERGYADAAERLTIVLAELASDEQGRKAA